MDRWFKIDARTMRCVPAGARPEQHGIDVRAAVELDRAPGEHERHVGMRTGWRHDAAAAERDGERARVARETRDRAWHLRIEGELAALRDQVGALERRRAALEENGG
jgi:uncharacterized protein YceH (UPF0502 family)